ncbi:MAG TPA: hypothetical protein VJ751_10340 [Pyrinomonadaceae bacterium]|nr:hypothetical protein [Pyrinomonadaceae bacterium]
MSVRDSWLKRMHWLRRKLNASPMQKPDIVVLNAKKSEKQNWIALTFKSLPNKFENFFLTVRPDEKSRLLNTLVANIAIALVVQQRPKGSMKMPYRLR